MSGGLYDAAPMPLRWRIVSALATLAAAAVLMLVIAEWTWRWIAPAPKAPAVASDADSSPAALITASPWFGVAPPSKSVSAPPAASSGLAGDARLLGIIAGHDGNGYALFRFADRGPILVATGQEIAPGVKLQAITGQGIRISDRGEARDIALRPAASGTTPRANASVVTPQLVARVQRTAACTPPGAGSGPVFRLNAELLTGIAAKPDSWSTAFSAGSNGLSMREGNAFAAMLGMKPGDRVTQANGIALRSTEDVLVAVIRPLLASQAVRVAGVHDDGRPAEWIFVNASACPA